MKRLFAILTLCAAMAATAGLGANPAAADGRGDSRQHRQERLSDRDYDRTSWRHQLAGANLPVLFQPALIKPVT